MRITADALKDLDRRDIRVIRAHARARRGKPRTEGHRVPSPEFRTLREIVRRCRVAGRPVCILPACGTIDVDQTDVRTWDVQITPEQHDGPTSS